MHFAIEFRDSPIIVSTKGVKKPIVGITGNIIFEPEFDGDLIIDVNLALGVVYFDVDLLLYDRLTQVYC
jgi:hypothetical protein